MNSRKSIFFVSPPPPPHQTGGGGGRGENFKVTVDIANSPRFAVLMGCACVCVNNDDKTMIVRDRFCIYFERSLVVDVTVGKK